MRRWMLRFQRYLHSHLLMNIPSFRLRQAIQQELDQLNVVSRELSRLHTELENLREFVEYLEGVIQEREGEL